MMEMTIAYAWFVLLIIFTNSESSAPNEKGPGVCISKGGRFAPYKAEGSPPSKVGKGSRGLSLCRIFRKRTCCTIAQTHPSLMAVRKLASTGEASEDCLHLWELLECSICDPDVGVKSGLPLICSSFCDRVYDACSGAYFSSDVKSQVLGPCGVNDFVCAAASKWVSNGTEFCHAAGFAVGTDDTSVDDSRETSCYGSKASLDSIADSWNLRSDKDQGNDRLGVLEDIHSWFRRMPPSKRVTWTVGGLVFTTGLFLLSKRKSRSRRQKLEAIQSRARKLRDDTVASQGNRNRSRRRTSDCFQ